jgi:cell fate (sporulation/competence/biofilm development) regulator YmcA (YheA/YmcA/DUF963 family)
LKSLDKLIDELMDDSVIKRYKKLEKIIDNDQKLNADYKKLLDLQKKMVIEREKNTKGFKLAKKNYDDAKDKVMDHLILSEYLDLLEEVNFDLDLVQKIVSQEINTDFE